MKTAIVTGSYGLIGSQAAKFFHGVGFSVVGVDDESRSNYFGSEAKVRSKQILSDLKNYKHVQTSILDMKEMEAIFQEHKPELVIHTAGQPSHDWASNHVLEDFDANARGTLNLLHVAKKHAPECVFIFTSTNKVYGDNPNGLFHYEEKATRWEPLDATVAKNGFNEQLSVDHCTHSLFGVSKLYADMVVQEYGRYFGMKTGVFRLGCVTGALHAGVEQHGFLSYLFRCLSEGRKYVIHGYGGKQVRDNIHAFDVIMAFYEFYKKPRPGEVYNIGGSNVSNCSVLEAINLAKSLTGKALEVEYSDEARKGDHIWYVSDMSKFKSHYPNWFHSYSLATIFEDMMSFGGAS